VPNSSPVPPDPTWAELRAHAAQRVARPAEAGWLLEEVSGLDAAELIAAADEPAPGRAVGRLHELLDRLEAGEPVQYVIGSWSFRGLEVMVDRRVLIPRPETEITAEVAITEAARLGKRTGPAEAWTGGITSYAVADLGTGSGALALALASALPDAEVWATDISPDALAVARANVGGSGSTGVRVRLAEGSWYGALPPHLRGHLTLVVSNPPYVAAGEALPAVVADHEPRQALVSGPTGLEAIEAVVAGAPGWLAPGGVLVCEIAPHQAGAAVELAAAAGFAQTDIRRDLAGRERVLVAGSPG
jgi:release factor glutamine methyltransferase